MVLRAKKIYKIILSVAVILIALLVFEVAYGAYVNGIVAYPQFNKQVDGHVYNAINANDPATMKSELLAAKQGMRNLGLTPDMYGRYWSWEQNPDVSMQWQYQCIDSMIVRIDTWQQWQQSQFNRTTGEFSQQFTDVNSVQRAAMRGAMSEGDHGIDGIAQDTFHTWNFTFVYVFLGWVVLVNIVLLILTILIAIGFKHKYYYRDERGRRWHSPWIPATPPTEQPSS